MIFIPIGIILFLILCCLIIMLYCFKKTFYNNRKKEKIILEKGLEFHRNILKEHFDLVNEWYEIVKNMPHKEFYITSFDGLKLKARYYEYDSNAPIEIMIHGYRGNSLRDLSGGVIRCFKMERNCLLIDNRANGDSEGNVISFGINEHKDCLSWIDFVINNINKNAQIILTGVSMGAASVLMASSYDLPKNVIGILADCGYSSNKEIIKKVIKEMKLNPNIFYHFVKLSARIFGKFNLDEISPVEAVKKAKVPIFFIHCDCDDFVPYEMSVKNYEACNSIKTLITIEKAEHGLCFVFNQEKYIKELKEFFEPYLNK